jgi:hypothetical protein
MHSYNYIWVFLLITRLNLDFLSPKLSRGIYKVVVCLCPCGFENPRNTLRWKLLQLASVHLRIILLGLRTANKLSGTIAGDRCVRLVFFILIHLLYLKNKKIIAAIASARVEVGRDCHGFYRGFAKDSVGIWFHLDDRGSIDQGSSLYTYEDHLLWTATSSVVYVEDSLFEWSAEEDCVW